MLPLPPAALGGELDYDAAPHLTGQDFITCRHDISQSDSPGHSIKFGPIQILGQALPG